MLDSLTHIPVFQDLEPDQLAQLETLFEYFTCPPQTIIFEQGDPAGYLYLILEGSVTIHYKPYDGPTIKITHLRDGDVFGWSAVIGSSHYTSTLISESTLQAVRIRGEDLLKLSLRQPDFGKIVLSRLARVVSSRWKNSQSQVQAILKQGLAKVNTTRKKKRSERTMATAQNHSREEQLRSLLESLSAYVEQYHGGSVEFVSYDGRVLKVKLGGACLGCPLLPATLHGWVAGTVHQFFPDIEVAEQK
jgi:CRP-like cAMP-binding protein